MMHWIQTHLLTTIIFLPLVGAVITIAIPSRFRDAIRMVSLVTTIVVFVLAWKAWTALTGTGEFEFSELLPWIPSVGVSYHVGVDGVGMILMFLSAFITPLAILGSWQEIDRRVKAFHVFILILETGMLGVFAALDLFLFYIFWEVVLIPMYFMIGIWGSSQRIRAAMKFVLYTMAGSVLMLAAILYGAWATGGSFDLLTWYSKGFGPVEQLWLFAAFALAFAIKVPVFPLHTWLPDAHTEAPTAGSVILAAVLLKMGTYGFYRFAMPLFPLAVVKFAPLFLALGVIGITGSALVAMVQPDLKRLIAYSSVAHLGFVMIGLFALEPHAAAGAVLQMVNHGISTGALFFLVGMIYARRHTRQISDYGGIARTVPITTAVFLFVTMSSVGLPGLNNFVGEFLILLGTFQTKTTHAAIAVIGVVLAALYMLWAVQRVFFGKITIEENRGLRDLTLREAVVLIPLLIMMVVIGIAPKPWLAKIERSTENFLALSKRVEMNVSHHDAH
ncbi:MAG: NADH-quinone oxidoreductase subunit M [Deltaproteobacteria bacterium]|nr:NADH-quinone oxidoreductase subunit M [Deltaproteobacteria bacterium]